MRHALRSVPLSLLLILFFTTAASAEATYVLPTPGIVWGGTAATARAAVQAVPGVLSAESDMSNHTVTVKVDDPKRLDDVIKALNDAGYTVGAPKAIGPEGKS